MATCLDIGCGLMGEERMVKLDRHVYPGLGQVDVIADLERPLPLVSDWFEYVRAWDILEHIRNLLPLMDELWRVLKPNGRLDVQVPRMPHPDAYTDPTHVRYFDSATFMYFTQGYGQRFQMSVKPWRVLSINATDNRIFVEMEPIK